MRAVNARFAQRLALLAAAVVAAWLYGGRPDAAGPGADAPVADTGSASADRAHRSPAPEAAGGRWAPGSPPAADGLAALERAVASRAQGQALRVEGIVERVLADDRNGSPHQRFIIRTSSGISLLVAHNLDLAPRLDGLVPGERVVVAGDYEWNDRGGVMHWTHDDPAGRHPAGYVEWRGRRYQ